MVNKKTHTIKTQAARRKLRVGFVPLTDCAPLVMAQELGLFRKFGLNVALSRELGWATIRDKIIHGELEAAHAVAGMPVAATLGLGSVQCDCLTALVLNLHGNAITLSNELWERGVRDGATLREVTLKARGEKTFTFGVVYPFSSHNFLLRGWLARAGIVPDRDARIVVVPPPQLAANLKAGNLDGFCVGEPWNSVAVQSRAGWCIAASAELDFGHPEKVLMVRCEFAEMRNAEHLALVAALFEACDFCDVPENRDQIVATLSRREYVGAPENALLRGLSGEFDFGHGLSRTVPDFTIFHRYGANEPCGRKAAWVIQHLCDSGIVGQASSPPARGRQDACPTTFALGKKVFRADIFEAAKTISRKGREERKGFPEKNFFATVAAVA